MLTEFKEYLRKQGKAVETIKTYLSAVSVVKDWLNGRQLTTETIREYIADARRESESHKALSPESINKQLAALRSYGEFLVESGRSTDNPVAKVKSIPIVKNETAPEVLTEPELKQFIETVAEGKSLRDFAMIQTMLQTGVRVSELVAIETGDIAHTRDGAILKVRNGKGGKYREIPLNSDITAILNAYMAEEKIKKGRLFPLSTDHVRDIVHHYEDLAGLTDIHPHLFRHQFATQLLKKADIVAVAALLGHSSVTTTMIYTRSTAAQKRLAVEGLFD